MTSKPDQPSPPCDTFQGLVKQGIAKSVGVDILDGRRIETIVKNFPQRFANRILTASEQSSMAQRFSKEVDSTLLSPEAIAFIARRWAAKEAISKALGTGIAKSVSFQQMDITKDAAGKPNVLLTGKAFAALNALGAKHVLLSLSDDPPWVIAFAVTV